MCIYIDNHLYHFIQHGEIAFKTEQHREQAQKKMRQPPAEADGKKMVQPHQSMDTFFKVKALETACSVLRNRVYRNNSRETAMRAMPATAP